MTHDDPLDNLSSLAIDPTMIAAAPAPKGKKQRGGNFIKVPMWWKEKLGAKPRARNFTYDVALHLLFLDFKNHHQPFKVPNDMLRCDGINRKTKQRELDDLERRGLIRIQRRSRRSPIVHVLLLA
jgi:hypothetical protein